MTSVLILLWKDRRRYSGERAKKVDGPIPTSFSPIFPCLAPQMALLYKAVPSEGQDLQREMSFFHTISVIPGIELTKRVAPL